MTGCRSLRIACPARLAARLRGGAIRRCAICCTLLLSLLTAAASAEELEIQRLTDLTLEELMSVEVTSVTGVGQKWLRAPAALYVITREDVRRSGHRHLAEALRLAPGVFVGQTNSHAWSIGMRGFNGGLANKTLILIDGRSVYDPLFSGTFWDVQDVLLEDLDHIEVIRGPGPTLWGANAVNGVVNITTRSARDTQGWYFSGGGGSVERAFGEFRYGGQLSDDVWFRIWGEHFERDDFIFGDGASSHDDWNMSRGGFRLDAQPEAETLLTLQGDIYGSDRLGARARRPVPGAHLEFENVITDTTVNGGHLLLRLSHESGPHSGWTLQTYYDRTHRDQPEAIKVTRDTGDIDFRHHFRPIRDHEILWGLAYRHTSDRSQPGRVLIMDPRSRSLDTFSGFVQDTITLAPERLFAMIGTKLEHNDYTGFEFQPSGRLSYTPDRDSTLWGAVTRAVRVPSRIEREGFIPLVIADPGLLAGGAATGEFVPLGVRGHSGADSEKLVAYEAGYRRRITPDFTADVAVFYNDYHDLLFVPPAVIDTRFNNRSSGETYGGELSTTWNVAPNWRLIAGYSFVDVQIHGPVLPSDERGTPHHQAHLRSYLDITRDLEFNGALYYVDAVPQAGAKDYLRLDLGVTWRPTTNLEIAVWGQNLLEPSHREFSAIEVQRGGYVQITVRY